MCVSRRRGPRAAGTPWAAPRLGTRAALRAARGAPRSRPPLHASAHAVGAARGRRRTRRAPPADENADQSEDLALRTTGRYGGVGLTIGKDENDDVLVLGALEGFAFDAGVRPGDKIVAVDGQDVGSLSVDAVKSLLRGEPGTSITLTVKRDGSPQPTLSMPVSRQLVRLVC